MSIVLVLYGVYESIRECPTHSIKAVALIEKFSWYGAVHSSNSLRIAAMAGESGSQKLTIDDLVLKALGAAHKGATPLQTQQYEDQKKEFEQLLIKSAIETKEISKDVRKIQVDEKVVEHVNNREEEEITVTSESDYVGTGNDYNYVQSTTEGLVWTPGLNIGSQFGKPEVIVRELEPGEELDKTKKPSPAMMLVKTHVENSTKVPPGIKLTRTSTLCRKCHIMEYTKKYRVPKSAEIQVRHSPRFFGLSTTTTALSASQLLQPMPDFEVDGDFVYFTQKGKLTWFIDQEERMSAFTECKKEEND